MDKSNQTRYAISRIKYRLKSKITMTCERSVYSLKSLLLNPILTATFIFIFASAAVFIWSYAKGDYNENFWSSFRVEAHGMLLDVLVFGFLLVILNTTTEKLRTAKRLQDEIDDFRGWETEEATRRILGNIRRLNKLGKTNIDLSYCYLRRAKTHWTTEDLKENLEINLEGASLFYTNLEEAQLDINLKNSRVIRTNMKRANLSFAKMQGMDSFPSDYVDGIDLSGAKLIGANLSNARLCYAKLEGADLSHAICRKTNFAMPIPRSRPSKMDGVVFRGADLRGAQGLQICGIERAKTLYEAKLDKEVQDYILSKNPSLLDPPKIK